MTSPDRRPTGSARSAAVAIVLTLVLAAVGVFVSLLSLLLPMASDSCGPATGRPICSATVQVVAALLPTTGLVVGLLVAVLGGVSARRRWGHPARWAGLGWLVFAAAAVVAWTLAGL